MEIAVETAAEPAVTGLDEALYFRFVFLVHRRLVKSMALFANGDDGAVDSVGTEGSAEYSFDDSVQSILGGLCLSASKDLRFGGFVVSFFGYLCLLFSKEYLETVVELVVGVVVVNAAVSTLFLICMVMSFGISFLLSSLLSLCGKGRETLRVLLFLLLGVMIIVSGGGRCFSDWIIKNRHLASCCKATVYSSNVCSLQTPHDHCCCLRRRPTDAFVVVLDDSSWSPILLVATGMVDSKRHLSCGDNIQQNQLLSSDTGGDA